MVRGKFNHPPFMYRGWGMLIAFDLDWRRQGFIQRHFAIDSELMPELVRVCADVGIYINIHAQASGIRTNVKIVPR